MKITKRFRVRVPARAQYIWLSLLGSSVLFSNLCRYPVVPSYRRCHYIQHNDTDDNDIQHNLLNCDTVFMLIAAFLLCYAECRIFILLCWVSYFLFCYASVVFSLCYDDYRYTECHYAECLGISSKSSQDHYMFLCNQCFLTE